MTPNVAWSPLPGSQQLVLTCPFDELLYEGERGPGKTDTLLMDFAQHVGQGFGSQWRGVIFRREYKNLEDIIVRSKRWFRQIFPKARFLSSKGDLKWVFPDGEELLFRAFKVEDDYWDYHGHEYCVEVGTPVLTPTGYVPIESLRVGDEVVTPGGVDRVTRVFAPKVKECVTASFYDAGSRLVARQVQSATHRLLTSEAAPYRSSPSLFRSEPQSSAQTLSWRSYISLLDASQESPAGGALQIGGKSSDTGGFWTHRDRQRRPPLWGELIALAGQPLLSSGFCRPPATQFHGGRISSEPVQDLLAGRIHEPLGCSRRLESFGLTGDRRAFGAKKDAPHSTGEVPNFQFGCRLLSRFGDGQLLTAKGSGQDAAPSQAGVVVRARAGLLLDVAGLVRTHSRCDAGSSFENPYDHGSAVPAGNVGFVDVEIVPCGQRLTVDISVGTNKLYITKGGVINSNCFIGWEELTSWPDSKAYDSMKSCNRSSYRPEKGQRPIPLKIRATTNPYGRGHNWVKKYFITPAPAGVPVIEGNRTRVRIFGAMRENPYLDASYIDTIDSIKDPNKRRAWKYGSWDITSGGMLDDIWDERVHVVQPFEIPFGWKIKRCLDWGFSKPFSVGWWAESNGNPVKLPDGTQKTFPRGTWFRIAEWYGSSGGENEGLRLTAQKVALGIKEREAKFSWGSRIKPGAADSSIFDTDDSTSVADNMAGVGIKWTHADKRPGSRKAGADKIRELLEASLQKPMESPGLFIFNTCRKWIELVPIIPRSEDDPDDVDSDAEDHNYDETRYAVTERAKTSTIRELSL